MFRHCVMFKWADGAGDAVKAEIAAGLNRLATLDAVTSYHHGPDLGVADGNWDYAIVGDFADEAAYRVYATEDGHLSLINDLIKPNISARAAVQYQLA
ncbi:MAG: Dabb family protein [Acidimicrobiales bacterium]|nr:Dabb family protein [Acidimicrobiales bacterium]